MRSGILCRLGKDESGNALALTAAAFFPILAAVGGGLDASRMYLAQSRLQQACDAGTLAARKQLGGDTIANGNIPDEIVETAGNFFAANFVEGMYGTEDVEYELVAAGDTQMNGSAAVTVPMSLMRVFGYDRERIAVRCSAELNLPNIDIALVLDMSGSMNGERIENLREAVMAFHDRIMSVKPEDARIRIGVIPYNGAVNVGSLLVAENPDWIADEWVYQSREAVFKNVRIDLNNHSKSGTNTGDTGDTANKLSSDNKVVLGDRLSFSRQLLPRNPVQLGSDNEAHYHWNERNAEWQRRCEWKWYPGDFIVGNEVWRITNTDWDKNHWNRWPREQKAACEANVEKFELLGFTDNDGDTVTVDPSDGTATRREFDEYRYKPIVFDTSRFKLGETVRTPTGRRGQNVSSVWNGCIEERQTVATSDWSPIPAEALDLNIDLVPEYGNPATQWKAMWPQITYDRGDEEELGTKDDKRTRGFNCPVPSVRLTDWSSDRSSFEALIDSLNPGGGTMHDIGVLWGARILSPDGLFAADNANAANGDAILRHLIFMTDGEMGANPVNTTSYGNYSMDGRFMGFPGGRLWNEADTIPINNARLDALCARIKNKNMTIWSVSFTLPLNQHTRGCASGNSRAFQAENSDDLVDAFEEIASNIAELRLVE